MNDIFVSMPFDERFDAVFDVVREIASRRQLNAVRIDQTSALAQDISDAIIRRIRAARLAIADITGNNANVLNEVGLSQAFGKPLVLLSQGTPSDAPFNVRKLRILIYAPDDVARLSSRVEGAVGCGSHPEHSSPRYN